MTASRGFVACQTFYVARWRLLFPLSIAVMQKLHVYLTVCIMVM